MATKAKPKKTVKKNDGRKGNGKKGADNWNYQRTEESGGLLTPRQQEIIRLTTLGCSTREIATLLDLAPSTVDNHKQAATTALGCGKATLLVRLAIQMGITKADEKLTKAEMTKLGGDWADGWNRT